MQRARIRQALDLRALWGKLRLHKRAKDSGRSICTCDFERLKEESSITDGRLSEIPADSPHRELQTEMAACLSCASIVDQGVESCDGTSRQRIQSLWDRISAAR